MRKHEKLLQKYMKKHSESGARVIRLDHRGIPDAIIIHDGVVSALLIDTSKLSVLAGNIKRKRQKGQNMRDYSEYDDKIQVLPKYIHSIEEYKLVMKMFKEGVTTYRISKNLNINHTTIYEWCKYGTVPQAVGSLKSEDNKIQEIIDEMIKNTIIIYDSG